MSKKAKPMRPVEAEFVFSQEDDCCGGDGLGQSLTVKITDGGGGPFAVIKTDRWALDDPSELTATLKWCVAQVEGMFDREPSVTSCIRSEYPYRVATSVPEVQSTSGDQSPSSGEQA
jgi:hypothetical protein